MTAIKNTPDLWRDNFPQPAPDAHKYHRGHTAIFGADEFTGATRLATEACSRIGSGLVSVLSETQAQVYRTSLPPDIMVTARGLDTLTRVSTILAGPGGCSEAQADALLKADPSLTYILDADAIRLWPNLQSRTVILTPHEGEFDRYFDCDADDMLGRADRAAKTSGAILVLKRPQTIIAAPDGQIVINRDTSRFLAKAGTGDVLAGLIAGLAAQGMSTFFAACAAVWIHSQAGERIGPGLLPQDILAELRPILRELLS